jgi:hypothetical protein
MLKIYEHYKKYDKLLIVTEIEVIFSFLRHHQCREVYICIDRVPEIEIKPKTFILSTFEFPVPPDFKIIHISHPSRVVMETVHAIHGFEKPEQAGGKREGIKKKLINEIIDEIGKESIIIFDNPETKGASDSSSIINVSSTEEAMWYLLENFDRISYLNVIDTGYLELEVYTNSGEKRKRIFSFFSSNYPPREFIERRKRLFSVIDLVNYHTFSYRDAVDAIAETAVNAIAETATNAITETATNAITETATKDSIASHVLLYPPYLTSRPVFSPSYLLLSSNILKNKFIPFFVFVHEYEGISGGFLRNTVISLRKLVDLCNLFVDHIAESDEELSYKTNIYIDKIKDIRNSLSKFGYKPQKVSRKPLSRQVQKLSVEEVIQEIRNRAVFYFDIFKRYRNRQYYNLNNRSCREILTTILLPESDVIVVLSKFKDKIVLFSEI